MTAFIVTVFLLVYLGMILGGLPLLQLDRTGVALLGAIALVATEAVTIDEARAAIDAPTLTLLFSFMVIAAQLRMGGFYAWAAHRLGSLALRPPERFWVRSWLLRADCPRCSATTSSAWRWHQS
jgi:Na+/H+ antiporter NhaD/arsenite permease-like protein